jgi:hypothetical protein
VSDRAVEIGTVAARWPGRGRPDPARIARLTELALERLAGAEGGSGGGAHARVGFGPESGLAELLAREVHRLLGGKP